MDENIALVITCHPSLHNSGKFSQLLKTLDSVCVYSRSFMKVMLRFYWSLFKENRTEYYPDSCQGNTKVLWHNINLRKLRKKLLWHSENYFFPPAVLSWLIRSITTGGSDWLKRVGGGSHDKISDICYTAFVYREGLCGIFSREPTYWKKWVRNSSFRQRWHFNDFSWVENAFNTTRY